MNTNLKNLIQFNLAMLLMSTSGTLGRMINLAPPVTIWLRCVLGALALFVFLLIFKVSRRIKRTHIKVIFLSSVLLGIHWISYFYSLKYSNVAVAMLSLFTYPVITTLLEPFILKTKFLFSNLILALIVLIGIFFLVPEFNLENKFTIGILIGLFSAVFYSLRNLLLKKNIHQYSGMTLMFYQLLINSFLLLPVIFIFKDQPIISQLPPLVVLAVVTTAAGHTMFVMSFKKFSITAVSIMSSLQPLLGILIAFIFLQEIPSHRTFWGGGLILITVIVESIRATRR